MAMRPSYSHIDQPALPKTSILGIVFFLLGAPNLYSLVRSQQRPQGQSLSTFPRFVMLALFAGAIAGAIEVSVF